MAFDLNKVPAPPAKRVASKGTAALTAKHKSKAGRGFFSRLFSRRGTSAKSQSVKVAAARPVAPKVAEPTAKILQRQSEPGLSRAERKSKLELTLLRLNKLESYVKSLSGRTTVFSQRIAGAAETGKKLGEVEGRLEKLHSYVKGLGQTALKTSELETALNRVEKLEAYVNELASRATKFSKAVTTKAATEKKLAALEQNLVKLQGYTKELSERSYGFAPHSELRRLATDHETHKNAVEKTLNDVELELAALKAGHESVHSHVESIKNDQKAWAESIDNFMKLQTSVSDELKKFKDHQHELLSTVKSHKKLQRAHEGRLVAFENELGRIKALMPKHELSKLTKAHKEYMDFVDVRLKEHEAKQDHIDNVFRENMERMDEFNNKFSAVRDTINGHNVQMQAWQAKLASIDAASGQAGQLNAQVAQMHSYLRALSNRVIQLERQNGRSPGVR